MWLSRKEWQRQKVDQLVDEALLFDEVEVTRCPTIHNLRCRSCGHQGRVAVAPDRPTPRFRCRKCGARCF